MKKSPNLLYILADQLRASSLPMYGERRINTPHLERLAGEGLTCTQAISTCPVCTPYRSMLLTGRHPQSTGHVINFLKTRHDEISLADVVNQAGYQTAWIGKWHLHTGSFPEINGADYVPEGRDRLGFQYWRGYNFHMNYFDGYINLDDWRCEQWQGYETHALAGYAREFLDRVEDDRPFCLFVSPHQPHATRERFVPENYLERVPEIHHLPGNIPDDRLEKTRADYRTYLAMILAVDELVGTLLDDLDRKGLTGNTLVLFGSDHGTQMGAHGYPAYQKRVPYEESLWVPLLMRWPGVFKPGTTCDALTAPVDIFPSLCSLLEISLPRTLEGYDVSAAWRGEHEAFQQDAVLTMNFTASHNYLENGEEWRGIRTKTHSYNTWLNGRVELFDLQQDPLQINNLAGRSEIAGLQQILEQQLNALMRKRHDQLMPAAEYAGWFDQQRRVIRNACGPLPDPEGLPNWSLV